MPSRKLPIESILEPLCRGLEVGHPIVLKAPPGSGKTTGVPPAILRDGSGWLESSQQIWVIQPRRLAARSVADWLARSHDESVGQTYGYHVRFDRKESKTTRVVSMTTGMFLRRMQSDPLLENVGCVVFDEFHERSLDLDLALALTTRLRTSLRDDLRIVVMSATLDPEPIVDYLAGQSNPSDPTPIALQCESRSFPIETFYHPGNVRDRLEHRMGEAVKLASQKTDGHVLVFLPGVGEIERCRRVVESLNLSGSLSIEIVALHGSLSPKQQDAAIRDRVDVRKIILATNIAETSVTVPGVTAVVDCGLAKTSVMDSRLGLSRLETSPISQASADQRAGRAGRTGPGVAVRLWPQAAHASRTPYDVPEIERADLSDMLLMLASLGETNLESIGWLTTPKPHALEAAKLLLTRLQAIDPTGRITELGAAMAGLPLHPRLSRFVIEASKSLPASDVSIAAACLSERDPFGYSVPLSMGEKIDQVRSGSRRDGRLDTIRRAAKQIERSIGVVDRVQDPNSQGSLTRSTTEDGGWTEALLAAFPDRVASRREDDPDRGRMVGGRGVSGLSAFDVTATPSPLMLCVDTDGGGKESRVRWAVPIQEDWFNDALIVDDVVAEFDPSSESIRCRQVRRYDDLVLRETPAAVTVNPSTRECLYDNALPFVKDFGLIGRISPSGKSAGENSVSAIAERVRRVELAEGSDGGESWLLVNVLSELCQTRTSFEQLRKAPWKDYLIGEIGYERWQLIQREAPTSLKLPSGNSTVVHYVPDKPPWIEAKIQECFGWHETPRILFGRVRVQLHLLGPNRRPQQITEDLASFWENTYGEIRKELRRRYPKHHWPEDPKTAKATHNGLKPR